MSTHAQVAFSVLGAVVGAAPWILDKAGVEMPPIAIFAGGMILLLAATWALYILLDSRSRTTAIVVAAVVLVGGGTWWSARALYVGVGRPTSDDLAKRADVLLPELRRFITRASTEKTSLDSAHGTAFLNAPSQEREVVRGKHVLDSGNLAQRHANEYAERFKAEARAVREGFLGRLPTMYRESSHDLVFENPATLESIRRIADEIERLKNAHQAAQKTGSIPSSYIS